MDMQGNTLYLMTSRKMFTVFLDGQRHQSNISFKINTKTMKATEANESYASHSFNQFVKFKEAIILQTAKWEVWKVGETRMVKLSDNRFAIPYATTQKKKTTVNYAVYSDTGQKIYSKKYSGMVFDGDSQPILYKGRIVWISSTKNKTKLYSIPAAF